MQFVFFDLEMIIFYNIIKIFYAKEKCIMKKIISMVILLAMALAMVLQPVCAADVATPFSVKYTFGGETNALNGILLTKFKAYTDSDSGNWRYFGAAYASAEVKMMDYKNNDTDYLRATGLQEDEWFALEIISPEQVGEYSVEFGHMTYSDKTKAGACDIYVIEKPTETFSRSAVNAALESSSPIGNIDFYKDGGATNVPVYTQIDKNVTFEKDKSYLIIFKTTRASQLYIKSIELKKFRGTEKYLFSGVQDTWTKLQGTSSYKTIEGIPYDQTAGGNWAWHSKSTSSDNFKVFALAKNSRLQVAGMTENDWFAIKIKSPGTGKWKASLEYVAYPTAGKCDVYIIRSCDENEVSGHLKNVNKAGTINFQDETLEGESTKSETLKDFTLYQDREYLVVFKVVKSDGSSNNLRPNQLILTEIPGAEIEEEKEYVSPNASFAETTNIDGFDGITVRSVRRGASVTLTAHKKEIEGYKFVGWKRGADTSNANAWVDITGDNYSVWTNTYLTAIYEPITESGDKVVEFWNQNGAYLGKKNENDVADALAITPTLTGFDVFLGWFTDENIELTTSSELKAGTTNAVAQYNASTISGVKHNGVLIDGADTYNASITLDKTSSDTTCWKRDGMIIAYGDTYKFNVWDATNITEGEEIIEDKVPVAILDYSEKHGAYMFEYDAGECEIAEAGIIFGGESIDSCTKKYTSQRKVRHNQFTVPNEDGVSAKGYVIFRQNDGSVYEVKYFSVAE